MHCGVLCNRPADKIGSVLKCCNFCFSVLVTFSPWIKLTANRDSSVPLPLTEYSSCFVLLAGLCCWPYFSKKWLLFTWAEAATVCAMLDGKGKWLYACPLGISIPVIQMFVQTIDSSINDFLTTLMMCLYKTLSLLRNDVPYNLSFNRVGHPFCVTAHGQRFKKKKKIYKMMPLYLMGLIHFFLI